MLFFFFQKRKYSGSMFVFEYLNKIKPAWASGKLFDIYKQASSILAELGFRWKDLLPSKSIYCLSKRDLFLVHFFKSSAI